MYLVAILLAFTYIILPWIAIKQNSINLSEFLIFFGMLGKKLHSKKIGIPRKVISKKNYLKHSFLKQSILGFSITFIILIFYLNNTNSFLMLILILIFSLLGNIFIGTSLNKYLPLN